jgi:hypothetical protein
MFVSTARSCIQVNSTFASRERFVFFIVTCKSKEADPTFSGVKSTSLRHPLQNPKLKVGVKANFSFTQITFNHDVVWCWLHKERFPSVTFGLTWGTWRIMNKTLSAMDVLAPISMKNAAKCDTSCELQNQWVIKTLNASCTSLGEYVCWSVCLSPPNCPISHEVLSVLRTAVSVSFRAVWNALRWTTRNKLHLYTSLFHSRGLLFQQWIGLTRKMTRRLQLWE